MPASAETCGSADGDIIPSRWLRVHNNPDLRWAADHGDQLRTDGPLLIKDGESLWSRSVATCSADLTEGCYAGEWALNALMSDASWGVARLSGAAGHVGSLREQQHSWLIGANNGALFSPCSGKRNASPAGQIVDGDMVGWLLDLAAGTLNFFVNGAPHGPGHTGVVGPVRVCVEILRKGGAMCLCGGTSFEVPPGTAMLFPLPAPQFVPGRLSRRPVPPLLSLRGECAGGGGGGAGGEGEGEGEGTGEGEGGKQDGFGWYYSGAGIERAGPVIRKRDGFGIHECLSLTGRSMALRRRGVEGVVACDGGGGGGVGQGEESNLYAGEWLLVRRTFGCFSGLVQEDAVHDGLDRPLFLCRRAFLIGTVLGGLFGNGHGGGEDVREGRPIESGDRLGWLLDLAAGTLQFFVNGAAFGPAHTGVVGPLRAAIELHHTGDTVRLLRGVSFDTPPGTCLLWPELELPQEEVAATEEGSETSKDRAGLVGSKRTRSPT